MTGTIWFEVGYLYGCYLACLWVWARHIRRERDVEAICLAIASGCRKGLQGTGVMPAGGHEAVPSEPP